MEPEQDRAVLVIIALFTILVMHHFFMRDKVLEARELLRSGLLAAAEEQHERGQAYLEDESKMRSLKRQLKDYKEYVRLLTVQAKRSGGQVPLFPNSFRVMAN